MQELLEHPVLYWSSSVLVASAAAGLLAVRRGLPAAAVAAALLAAVAGAVVGGLSYARLLAPAGAPESGGGGAIGAFAGAAAGAWLVARLTRLSFPVLADAVTPAVLLGYAVYRVGCFFNGCCFGEPSTLPWAMVTHPGQAVFHHQLERGLIVGDGTHGPAVHPTQLYHAVAGLVGCMVTLRMPATWAGARVAAGLAFYGVARFSIQFWRGDAIAVLGPLDGNQLAAIAMVAIAAAIHWRNTQRSAGGAPISPAVASRSPR